MHGRKCKQNDFGVCVSEMKNDFLDFGICVKLLLLF